MKRPRRCSLLATAACVVLSSSTLTIAFYSPWPSLPSSPTRIRYNAAVFRRKETCCFYSNNDNSDHDRIDQRAPSARYRRRTRTKSAAPPLDEQDHERDNVQASLRNCTSLQEIQQVLQDTSAAAAPTESADELDPNIATHAIRRLLELNRQDGKDSNGLNGTVLPSLVETVGRSVVLSLTEDGRPRLNAYEQADFLVSLSTLTLNRSRQGRSSLPSTNKLAPLANKVCDLMEAASGRNREPWTVSLLAPHRLIQVLRAVYILRLHRPKLTTAIAYRLQQTGLTGHLSPHYLCLGFHALLSNTGTQTPHETLLLFMRRLRKQAARRQVSTSDICLVLAAAPNLVGTKLQDDAQTLIYTIISKELRQPLQSDDAVRRLDKMTTSQIATVFSTAIAFGMDPTRFVLQDLCLRVAQNDCHDDCTIEDLSNLLQSMVTLELRQHPEAIRQVGLALERIDSITVEHKPLDLILRNAVTLHGKNQTAMEPFLSATKVHLANDQASFLSRVSEFELANLVWFTSKIGCTGEEDALLMRALGERFLQIALDERDLAPKSVSMILRFAVSKFGHDESVMEPFLRAATYLIQTEALLSKCSAQQVADLVWFSMMAKWNDERLVLMLGRRALEDDIIDTCTPTAACTILTSYTTISPRIASTQVRDVLLQLLDMLGPHLLTTTLTPSQTAAAIFAYAKASYPHDMGIFDHLTKLLSTSLDSCTCRQVANSLYACGKMTTWETDEDINAIDGNGESDKGPPYLAHARKFVEHLISKDDELSPQDVAQSIWACARLDIKDVLVIYPLAHRAKVVAPQCNSREVANILWGLSKVDFDDATVVAELTARITCPNLDPSSQEAANVLYALGRMELADEKAFKVLSEAMVKQSKTSSAQAIANALWAYKAVGFTPPRELLDSWMTQKLDLVIAPQMIE